MLESISVWGMQIYFKKTPSQVLSCEFYEIFKSNFFNRTPPVAASDETLTTI